MKNLFLKFVLIFSITFSFAGTNSTDSKLEKIAEYKCVTVITTCGIYGSACGETQVDRAMLALVIDEWVCP